MRDKVTRQCQQTTTSEERGAEADSNRGPSACQPNALPVGQTGSRDSVHRLQLLKRARRAEAELDRGSSAYQPNALPLGQTGLLSTQTWNLGIIIVSSAGLL